MLKSHGLYCSVTNQLAWMCMDAVSAVICMSVQQTLFCFFFSPSVLFCLPVLVHHTAIIPAAVRSQSKAFGTDAQSAALFIWLDLSSFPLLTIIYLFIPLSISISSLHTE